MSKQRATRVPRSVERDIGVRFNLYPARGSRLGMYKTCGSTKVVLLMFTRGTRRELSLVAIFKCLFHLWDKFHEYKYFFLKRRDIIFRESREFLLLFLFFFFFVTNVSWIIVFLLRALFSLLYCIYICSGK